MGKKYQITAFTLAASAMQGCAYVPNFDVPNGKYNEPTAYPIAERVVCEVVEIVENRTTPTHAAFLWDGNYDVEASLSLDVNDTGGLAPSLSSIVPYSAAATSLVWGATATFSESRDQNFTENIRFNVREAFKNWADQHKRAEKRGENLPPCPQKAADTNLSGDLGIKDIVALAASTPGLDTGQKLDVGKGAFGGSVQFLVTKSLTAAGPTWTLTHFKGPGGLGSLSRVNTDKLTIAFAQHVSTHAAKQQRNQEAYELMIQIQTNSIAVLLSPLVTPH